MMPRLKFAPFRGSHLPLLMRAVQLTIGPVLELGCGLYSTNPLHWACFVPKRKLVSYENNPAFFDFLKSYERDFHEVHCVTKWDDVDLSGDYSVALVDHEPSRDEPRDRRWREAVRLQHVEYVVMHDTERRNERQHRMTEVAKAFKYHFWFRDTIPNTTVYSNIHDLTNFLGTA